MSKYLIDIFLCIAYGIFLLGASGSFRYNGAKKTVLIMLSAITMNICISLPLITKILSAGQGTGNPVMVDMFFGTVFVWTTFLAALVFRIKKSLHIFHALIAVVEICWFLNIVLFIYGTYRFSVS